MVATTHCCQAQIVQSYLRGVPIYGSLASRESAPKWQLGQFSHFCSAHPRDQHTNYTTWSRPCIGNPHQQHCLQCCWCGPKLIRNANSSQASSINAIPWEQRANLWLSSCRWTDNDVNETCWQSVSKASRKSISHLLSRLSKVTFASKCSHHLFIVCIRCQRRWQQTATLIKLYLTPWYALTSWQEQDAEGIKG